MSTGAVGRMTDRAGETVVDVAGVLIEARIAHDVVQVVAFGAKSILAFRAEVRREEPITSTKSWFRTSPKMIERFWAAVSLVRPSFR